jgi:hypothetical protein
VLAVGPKDQIQLNLSVSYPHRILDITHKGQYNHFPPMNMIKCQLYLQVKLVKGMGNMPCSVRDKAALKEEIR